MTSQGLSPFAAAKGTVRAPNQELAHLYQQMRPRDRRQNLRPIMQGQTLGFQCRKPIHSLKINTKGDGHVS